MYGPFGKLLLVIALGGAAIPAAAGAPNARATLTRDVDRVESLRAAKRLQYRFAHLAAAGDWAAAAALFAPDGALLERGAPQASGPSAITTRLQTWLHGGRPGLDHHEIAFLAYDSPVATLSADGDSARIRWRLIAMLGGQPRDDARWLGGIVEAVYVRRQGQWRIAAHDFHPMLEGPYKTGWHSAGAELPAVPILFDPADMGRPVTLGEGVPATTRAVPLAALATRIRALTDEQALLGLQNAYGYYIDRKMWDDVVDLFEPAGSLVLAQTGTYKGSASILRALERDGPAGLRYGELNDHLQADPLVTIAADGAHARVSGFDIGMIGNNRTARWTLARFDNDYVKRDGVWRIAAMRLTPLMRTDHGLGWGRSWIDERAPDAAHSPDGPPDMTLPLPAKDAPRHPAPMALPAARIQLARAAAYDAIENLSGAYGVFLDDQRWEDLGSIFAAQGERDSAGGGFIRTPARIASFSRGRYGGYNPHRGNVNMHIRTQPVIDVSADATTAQERSRLWQFVVAQADAPPGFFETGLIFTGLYEDDVVFENGAWKFKRVDLDHLLYTLDYRHGWTRIPEGTGKLMDPPLDPNAKFDAPGLGDTFPPFPKVGHMWFHYANPVSGRKPPYLMPKTPLPEP